MHRSGTSALTRMLGSLGCDLPGTLMPPDEHNERGYWESEPISALNDALLESAGSAWDDWEPFNPGWYASPVAAGFRDQACAVLEHEFQDSRIFVLKDPRVGRLLPFWIDVLTGFGADTRVAMPIRNPLEVAGSLQARDAIDPSVGLLLWLRHVLDAEVASRDRPRVFVRFVDQLRDWQGVAVNVAQELDLSWPRQSTTARVEIEEALAPSARHQVAEDSAVLDRPDVSAWVATAFEILDRWGRGDVREPDSAALDGVRVAFDDAGTIFARAVATGMRAGQRNRDLEREVRALQGVVEDREGQIDSLNRAVADRDENAAYLGGLVKAKDDELDKLGGVLTDRDVKIDALQHAVAGRDGEIKALNDAVAHRDERIDELGGVLTDRDVKIDALQHAVAGRDGEIKALNDAVAHRDERIDELGRQVTDREHSIGDLRGEIAEREGEVANLQAAGVEHGDRIATLKREARDRDEELGALRDVVVERDTLSRLAQDRAGQIDDLHGVVEDRDRELASVYDSTSWRLTQPLRVGKKALRDALGAVHGGVRSLAHGSLRIVWRLLPLPASMRERLRHAVPGSVPFLGPLARSAPASGLPGTYMASGWLDLADRNYEARKNGTDLPILFDSDWYVATYPDVRLAGVEPLSHYLEHGALEGRWPVDLNPEEVDPLVEALHRLDFESEEAGAFDPMLCRALYPDLAALSDPELALICTMGGERIGSKGAFVAELCGNPREIPLDFDASEYLRLYPDLRFLADQSPLEALRHYMCHGRFEPRLHTLRTDPMDPSAETASVPGSAGGSGGTERPLCVLAHVFYPELWDELADYLRNLPADRYDLYVNLVDDTFDAGLLARIRATFPAARVYVSENVGRDLGGHFQLLRNVRMEDYRIFCLVHTKKSPHMSPGEVQRWRRKLLGPLMGSPETAVENIATLVDDETIGLLGSAACRYTEMNDNREKYDLLLERLNVADVSAEPEFVSGTMMFLRSQVLARVFEAAADLTLDREGRLGEGAADGAWEHAVERVFGAVARDMNCRLEWR